MLYALYVFVSCPGYYWKMESDIDEVLLHSTVSRSRQLSSCILSLLTA